MAAWVEDRQPSHTILTSDTVRIMVDAHANVWELQDNTPGGGYTGKRKRLGALTPGEFDLLIEYGIEHPNCENTRTTLDNLVGIEYEEKTEKLPKFYARYGDILIKAKSIKTSESNPLGSGYSDDITTITVEAEDDSYFGILRGYLGRFKCDLEVTMNGKLVRFPSASIIRCEMISTYGSDPQKVIEFSSSGNMMVLGDAHQTRAVPRMDPTGDKPRILDI